METASVNVTDMPVFHREFNLDKKDNLHEVPAIKAVFGVFAIVNDEPINCRFVGKTENLRKTISELFESAPSTGLKKFMQGPWYKVLRFEEANEELEPLQKKVDQWSQLYLPNIDDDGDYPGYYDY
jgi:predicted solute-binding protein